MLAIKYFVGMVFSAWMFYFSCFKSKEYDKFAKIGTSICFGFGFIYFLGQLIFLIGRF